MILSSRLAIPDGLAEVITVVEFPLPTAAEIRVELQRLLQATGQRFSEADLDAVVRSCQGLSLERIRRVIDPCDRQAW